MTRPVHLSISSVPETDCIIGIRQRAWVRYLNLDVECEPARETHEIERMNYPLHLYLHFPITLPRS